jgi:predicted Zn-dependent protease
MKKSEIFAPKVQQQPDNLLFRFSLAQALCNEDSPERAIPHLEVCIAARCDWMIPHILLGKAWLHLNDPQRAKSQLQTALHLAIEQSHEEPAAEIQALLADL